MAHVPFYTFFPEIAGKETRVVTVTDNAGTGIPPGDYAFIDLYCNDGKCDCRNVYIHVVHKEFPKPIATLCYGWESLAYYKKWLGGNDNDMVIQFKGPSIAIGASQSQFANHWLRFFAQLLQKDKDYASRLPRHYQMVKNFIKK